MLQVSICISYFSGVIKHHDHGKYRKKSVSGLWFQRDKSLSWREGIQKAASVEIECPHIFKQVQEAETARLEVSMTMYSQSPPQ